MSRTQAPVAPAPTLDLTVVDGLVAEIGGGPDALIPLLQALQAHYGYLPQTALRRLCELTGLRPADVTGVATFYPQFRHRPMGKHLIRLCHGTATASRDQTTPR